MLFNFHKGTEVLKEGIRSGLFSVAYQNGDQYCDVGPLCPIGCASRGTSVAMSIHVLIFLPAFGTTVLATDVTWQH